MRFLTSEGEVGEAMEEASAGTPMDAVATNPDGNAGVLFGGFYSGNPQECVARAENALAELG